MNRTLQSLILLTFVLALGACASKPATTVPPTPPPDTTPIKREEASPQQRAVIRTELAAGYYERGQMDVALEELGAAKTLDPSYPKLYNIYGLVYAMLGERGKAEENFRQAISLAPNDPDIRANWAAYLCATGRANEALPELEQVLKDPLYKTPEIALINAGKCSVALGQTKNADEYFRRAMTASPGNATAAYNLALLAYREQRVDSLDERLADANQNSGCKRDRQSARFFDRLQTKRRRLIRSIVVSHPRKQQSLAGSFKHQPHARVGLAKRLQISSSHQTWIRVGQ